MTAPTFDLDARLKSDAAITAEDTLAMRRLVWPDGKIDPGEADAIFDLNSAVGGSSREWVDFFVEAISVYVVHQQAPEGYVDDAKADWLMAKIDSDGRVDSLGELELLVKILEDATNVPESLKAYALKQIETVVLTGTGPTRDGGSLDAGSITASEVKLLRRMLFAQSSDGPGTVSRAEAEMLFRIKDATLGATNAPEWKTLFVQAVGNHLMAHSDYHPITRERAAELDAFMNGTHVGIGGFFRRMMASNPIDGARNLRAGLAAPADYDAAVAADNAVTPVENAWLNAEIEADKQHDPLEEALLAFIAAERG
ncbi:hypothetical protein GCM10009087_55690 [Sphingomonas oligophenolica]|uniref:Uncharacterized protein n=1 Tax=Sphingomonas oligophenolica TaxID=301154 RepID=A0ABU9Y5B4_9SPHN